MRGLDDVYRMIIPLSMFSKGWGNPTLIQKIIENHKQISKRESCKHLIGSFDIKMTKEIVGKTSTIVEGTFISPFYKLLPESMDDGNKEARFQLITPNKWPTKYKPLCILYPRTGDHSYRKRRHLSDCLIKDGIASLIHINPFYWSRKPKEQWRSSLNYVSDLFVMGGALILEGQVLLHWANKHGFGPLAIHGVSMGGYMASLAASVYTEPVCLIPCLSGTTASQVYTEGAISRAVGWKTLSRQYHNDTIFSRTIRSQIDPPIPYHLQKFTKKKSIDDLVEIQSPISQINGIIGLLPPISNAKEPKKINIITDNLENQNIQAFNHDQPKYSSAFETNTSINRPLDFLQSIQPMTLLSLAKSFIRMTSVAQEYGKDSNLKMPFTSERDIDPETKDFMRDILDFFTHLGNYSTPVDPRLVTAVIADHDKYIPVEGVPGFSDIWNSKIEIEILKGWDHVGSNLGNTLRVHDKFREAIVRTLNRYVELYDNEPGPFGVKK